MLNNLGNLRNIYDKIGFQKLKIDIQLFITLIECVSLRTVL